MPKISHLGITICGLLVLPPPSTAQIITPFLGSFLARPMADKTVPAHEPWSAGDHAAAINSAVEAATLLPDRTRTILQVGLATLLGQSGDTVAEARVLRKSVDQMYRPGAPLHEIAQRLVEVGAGDAARKLVADTAEPNERQQVLSGMIEGAIKAGNFDIGSEALRAARRLPRPSQFDPFAFQAKTLAVALARAGRYRQALAAFPTAVFGPELPSIAKQACAADPSLADAAGAAMALAALKQAANKFAGLAPVNEVEAYQACKGEAAAHRLVDAMPPDIADRLSVKAVPVASGNAYQLAADAERASDAGGVAKADQLFAAAKAQLDADFAARGASRDKRQSYDTTISQVAVFMVQSNRREDALALVEKLPALEQLPILFTLAQTAVRRRDDPAPFLAAIGTAFAAEPAFIEVEAEEIRALRGALPLGSPVYGQIEPWLDALPPVAAAQPMNQGFLRNKG